MGMKQKNRSKRGLLTLSVLLISLSLVFLASSISGYSNSIRNVNAAVLGVEAANSQFEAAEYALRSMVASEAVSATVTSGSVLFESNTSSISLYPEKMRRVGQFFEGRSLPGNLAIDTTDADNPKLYIRPYNVSLDFSSTYANISAPDTSASAGRITGYAVNLKLTQPGVNLAWSSQSTVASTSPDALNFSIGAQGSDGAASTSATLNRSATSVLIVRDSVNATLANITFFPSAQLYLNYRVSLWSGITISLNTTNAIGATRVELGENIINVRLDDGTVRRGPAYVGN